MSESHEKLPEHELTPIDTSNELFAAMAFLAALAYPESYEKRDRAISAMKSLCARGYKALGGTDDVSALITLRKANERGTLNRLWGRLRKRLYVGRAVSSLVGRVCRPGLRERISFEDQKKTRDHLMRQGASMDAAARLTMTVQTHPGPPKTLSDYARATGNRAKFMSEWWAPEVFHLALSFFVVSCKWSGTRGLTVARLLANPDWAPEALRRAEGYVAILTRSSNLPASLHSIRTSRLIRLIPTA